jgi:3-oxoacyl-(acyl-carrier-protein) synthase
MDDVFLEAAPLARISAVSSYIGNSMGALGGIQGVVSALALYHQMYPPHPTLSQTDPKIKKRLMGPTAESGSIHALIQNSYCFMGKHSSLVFKACRL